MIWYFFKIFPALGFPGGISFSTQFIFLCMYWIWKPQNCFAFFPSWYLDLILLWASSFRLGQTPFHLESFPKTESTVCQFCFEIQPIALRNSGLSFHYAFMEASLILFQILPVPFQPAGRKPFGYAAASVIILPSQEPSSFKLSGPFPVVYCP